MHIFSTGCLIIFTQSAVVRGVPQVLSDLLLLPILADRARNMGLREFTDRDRVRMMGQP